MYDLLIARTDAEEVLRTQRESLSADAVRYYTRVATGDDKLAQVEWAKAKLAEMEAKADQRARQRR